MTISVVVATRNRAKDLARLLPTLAMCGFQPLDLVVVDQSDGDDSRGAVAALAPPSTTYVRQERTGKATALNEGLRRARGEIIACTDDDATVPPDWLQRGLCALDGHPQTGVLFGAVVAPDHDERRLYVPQFRPERRRVLRSVEEVGLPDVGMGANLFVRSGVFESIGLFDELMGPGGRFRSGDDWDLALRALAAGFTVVQEPAVRVFHHGARPLADGSARRRVRDNWHGLGAGLTAHARRGTPGGRGLLLRTAAEALGHAAGHLSRLQRPVGIGRVLAMTGGVAAGVASPLSAYEPLAPLPPGERSGTREVRARLGDA